MGSKRKFLYFLKPWLPQALSSEPQWLGVVGETRENKTGHKVALPDRQVGRPLKIEKQVWGPDGIPGTAVAGRDSERPILP